MEDFLRISYHFNAVNLSSLLMPDGAGVFEQTQSVCVKCLLAVDAERSRRFTLDAPQPPFANSNPQ